MRITTLILIVAYVVFFSISELVITDYFPVSNGEKANLALINLVPILAMFVCHNLRQGQPKRSATQS